MTAESTVPPPAGQPRATKRGHFTAGSHPAAGHSPLAVVPPRETTEDLGAAAPFRRTPAHRSPFLPLLAADVTAALLSCAVLTGEQRQPLPVTLLLATVTALNARAGLYGPRHDPGPRPPQLLDELPALCGRIALGWVLLATLLAAVSPYDAPTPAALLAGCVLHTVTSCAGRGAVHWRRRQAAARRPRTALLIGPETISRRVAAALLRQPRCGVRPVGLVTANVGSSVRELGPEPVAPGMPHQQTDSAIADVSRGTSAERAAVTVHESPSESPSTALKTAPVPACPPVLTSTKDVHRVFRQNDVQLALLIDTKVWRQYEPLPRILDSYRCPLWRIDAEPSTGTEIPVIGPRATGHLAGFPCAPLPTTHRTPSRIAKRMIDMAVSGMLLLLTAPVLLGCAAALRISAGPGVVFRQERIGLGGRPFVLLKFRTHRPADAEESATRWSVANERSMGWFCRFLRRTSLDELLQLWNVFRGDMSLVGPRPERPFFVAEFSRTHPGYAQRHRMPVGITGLAQIHGLRGDTSIEDRCRYDNTYIDTWSLWQDFCILLRTAVELVRPTGS